jgi:hypothetical protein
MTTAAAAGAATWTLSSSSLVPLVLPLVGLALRRRRLHVFEHEMVVFWGKEGEEEKEKRGKEEGREGGRRSQNVWLLPNATSTQAPRAYTSHTSCTPLKKK